MHFENLEQNSEVSPAEVRARAQAASRCTWVSVGVNLVQWPDWFARFYAGQRPERMGLRFDRAMMSLDAAVQKLGVALESASVGQSLIASGKLQPVFEEKMSIEVQGHFMVYPARHASRPEVKSFVEWLREEAGA